MGKRLYPNLSIEKGVQRPPTRAERATQSPTLKSVILALQPDESVFVANLKEGTRSVYAQRVKKWRPGAAFLFHKEANGCRIFCISDPMA